jgi:CheY-like chemotaxis protein/class 3 adenylate cyclase
LKYFSSKEIRFSNDSLKSCVGFIDLVDSTKNIVTMDNLEYIRKYYSKFINSVSEIIKGYNGKIIKNMGDCLLFYFPQTIYNDNNKNMRYFSEAIECGFKILDERYKINIELSKQHLPPFNYRISMDYGLIDLALVGDYSQIDLFGSTINLCSKINSSSLSAQNKIIIGDNLYKVLQIYPDIVNNHKFIKNDDYKITEISKYSSYTLKRKNIVTLFQPNDYYQITDEEEQLNFIADDLSNSNSHISKSEKRFFENTNNTNKRLILVDDDQEILFTYRLFLEGYDYNITSFTDPFLALDCIRKIPNFDNLLVILDIRMENLNGLQLYQQIKSIDPTIKIIFVTVLDIINEILTIVPGLSKEQIMRKPVDKKLFTNTIERLLLN